MRGIKKKKVCSLAALPEEENQWGMMENVGENLEAEGMYGEAFNSRSLGFSFLNCVISFMEKSVRKNILQPFVVYM